MTASYTTSTRNFRGSEVYFSLIVGSPWAVNCQFHSDWLEIGTLANARPEHCHTNYHGLIFQTRRELCPDTMSISILHDARWELLDAVYFTYKISSKDHIRRSALINRDTPVTFPMRPATKSGANGYQKASNSQQRNCSVQGQCQDNVRILKACCNVENSRKQKPMIRFYS